LAIFAVCVLSIAALDRAGAPERLVRALGPLLTLIAIGVFGIGGRTATLARFIAAGRQMPPIYAALAVAAISAGVALGLGLRFVTPADPIGCGAMVGVGVGAAALGPLVRRFGGASLSDVIATRFPNPLLRIASGLAAGTGAALVAFAGYRTAVANAEALITTSRPWAETIVGVALLASVAAGGLASLVWCSAATGAGIGLIALIGWILAPESALTPIASQGGAPLFLFALTSPEALTAFVAAAIGMAGLIGAAPPTSGCRNATQAVKSGLGGILLFAALAALAISAAPIDPVAGRFAGASPLEGSLMGAATLAVALALAGLGVLGASRAFGAALARPARPFPTLASVRLARMRIAQAGIVIACASAASAGVVDSPTALIGAMALTVAVTAPIGALAATGRAGPLAAAAALLTAVAVAAARLIAGRPPSAATELLGDALAAGAAAFVVGSLVALVAPRRAPAPTPGPFDPFSGFSG
jgi:cation/acetate symporter